MHEVSGVKLVTGVIIIFGEEDLRLLKRSVFFEIDGEVSQF